MTATAKAHLLKNGAEHKKRYAVDVASTDPTGAYFDRREAADMEKAAAAILTLPGEPVMGTGGELTLPCEDRTKLPGLLDAVKRPDYVNLNASRERVLLADKAGVFNLAFDAAESIKARDSYEKMLSHQMAAAHNAAMETLADSSKQRDTVERVRLINASARLMTAFQDGMVTLGRYRSGGKQTVVVQYNHVQGGQAVISGAGDIGGGKQK